MDRGIRTEETLAPVRYLVGTPKGRLTQIEKAFLDLPWQEVRQRMDVKLLTEDGELYVLVRSEGRLLKERGHAPTAAEEAVASAGRAASAVQQPGPTDAQARRRQEGGGSGLGPGRYRCAQDRQGTRRARLLVPAAP